MTICGSIAMIKDMIVNLEHQIARDPGLRSCDLDRGNL